MTAPLPSRRPDALDLAECLADAAYDLNSTAKGILDEWHDAPFGSRPTITLDDAACAREAANRVLAALDAYEARK